MTAKLNHLFYAVLAIVGLLAAMPPDVVSVLPEEWRPYVMPALLAAAWLKAHRNLFVNPDGTPAFTAWLRGEGPKQ